MTPCASFRTPRTQKVRLLNSDNSNHGMQTLATAATMVSNDQQQALQVISNPQTIYATTSQGGLHAVRIGNQGVIRGMRST